MINHAFREAVVGSPATVKRGLGAFLERTKVDELMVVAAIFEHAARLRSFELVAQVRTQPSGVSLADAVVRNSAERRQQD